MSKKIVGALVALAFGVPVLAFAAANTTFITLNGGPNATVPQGNTVNANVTYNMTSGTDAESLSWQIVDSVGNAALPPVCVDIQDRTTAGTFNTSFPIGTGGQTEGTWRVRVKLYGDTGVGVDNQCNNGDLVDTFTSQDILTISTPADSSTQSGSPFAGNSTGFCALFPGLCLNSNSGITGNSGFNTSNPFGGSSLPVFCQQYPTLCGFNGTSNPPPSNNPPSPPPPTINPKCTAIAPYLSAQMNVYSTLGQQLQATLVQDDPHSIPALDASIHTHGTVPMGYYGPQTQNALAMYNSKYHCN